ncbi:MAG TPA: site-2 protease family protein [Actinomycetota bacterium]|nr:site-2 protease family protein [Actinomycetota bacterium]
MDRLLLALELAGSIGVALLLREHVRALVADRLGDGSPRRFGWLRLDPRPKLDPLGSLILPGLIVILWASGAGYQPPPFAYAKPMPLEPSWLRRGERDAAWVALAGPLANLALAVVIGVLVRIPMPPEAARATAIALYTNVVFFVFHLMPIPGLDGAHLLARVLPPRARHTYENLGEYLPLFVLLVFFLLAGPLLGIVQGLSNLVCRVVAGVPC